MQEVYVAATDDSWLTLKEASDLLGVHPATLRTWADKGQVAVARTPGGHRRFRRSDVQGLMQPERPGADTTSDLIPATASADVAISYVRRDLSHLNPFGDTRLATLSEEDRLRFQHDGRQLVHLAIQYVARRNGHQAILDQAAEIGRIYGRTCIRHHLALVDAVRTFSHFREAVLDAICPTHGPVHAGDQESVRVRREMNTFFDAPFYAMLEVYDRSHTTCIVPS
jgi:excisionase family DNA binding protein